MQTETNPEDDSGPATTLQPAESPADWMVSVLRFAPMLCAMLSVLLGIAVLAGWRMGMERLMTVVPGHIRMKPNAAACFIAAGSAMGALMRPSLAGRRIARVLAVMVLLCAALTLAEYIFHLDLHIDQFLFVDPVQQTYPGRMAQITAINFFLAGLSMLFLSGGRHTRMLAQWTGLLISADAFAAIVAYLYGVRILYGSLGYTSMALHTGVGFVILGAGLVLAEPTSTMVRVLAAPQNGGWLARRLLPGAVLLPVALGWLYLRPTLDFGGPRFGMALFAVTLSVTSAAALWFLAVFLNRGERQSAEMVRVREESAAAVRQSERELRLVTDHLPTLLSYIDPNGRFQRVNRTYEQWMGMPASAIVGGSIRELLGDEYWERSAFARERVSLGETATFEAIYPTVQGERRVLVTYAPDLDDKGAMRGIACMVVDVDEQRRAEAALRESQRLELANLQLQELATTDELTGLRNRRAFEERLRSDFALAQRHGRDLSVLMIDIDNFKARNDTWGHAAGDEVLRRLGEVLFAAFRTPDVAARYGGEEFTVLLPESNLQQGAAVAERIQRLIADQVWTHATVTLSIGVASIADGIEDGEQLVRAADAALYEAKRAGKDRTCLWSGASEFDPRT